MHFLLRGLLDVLYPPRCEVCGRLRHPPFCADCRAEVEMISSPLCERCGEPFDPQGQGAPLCAECREKPPRFSLARSAALYEGPLVRAIWQFKYDCQMCLGEPLGRLMADALPRRSGGFGGPANATWCAQCRCIGRA